MPRCESRCRRDGFLTRPQTRPTNFVVCNLHGPATKCLWPILTRITKASGQNQNPKKPTKSTNLGRVTPSVCPSPRRAATIAALHISVPLLDAPPPSSPSTSSSSPWVDPELSSPLHIYAPKQSRGSPAPKPADREEVATITAQPLP
jgi:hypothetical protein